MENIKHLVALSQYYGANPDFVIAGGGNTSFKNETHMWVKASGTSMADIDEAGFVCLDRNKLNVISDRIYSKDSAKREAEVKEDLHSAIVSPQGLRPSVEASLHNIINYAFVVHTHPTIVNGVLCANKSEDVIKDMFGDEVIYVPYTDPGYVLFKEVSNSLKEFHQKHHKEAQIIFLENHGVFVGADSAEEIHKIYKQIVEKIAQLISLTEEAAVEKTAKTLEELGVALCQNESGFGKAYTTDSSALTKSLVNSMENFKSVAIPFTPDNIVYCKSKYLFIEAKDNVIYSLARFVCDNNYPPKVIACEGKGILVVEENEKSARIALDVFMDMMKVASLTKHFGGPRPMTKEQIAFIDNWEVENYRRQVSKLS